MVIDELHLNGEKCMFKQRPINYLGEVITGNGVYPDPEKVKAIAEMKAPSDKAELHRFLCRVTYVCVLVWIRLICNILVLAYI